ncbi:hypothetical protein S460_22210 [Salmonella enterica subsp. diarizonae]|nr:hypothetical protein [Salmonella enterica subsp. diarizonae]EDQ3623542.1 hypothetical protein [Salmonella enterica subsp. diarizonae]
MRHVPADARQTGIYPVSLENQPGCRSGELSLCRLFITEGIWPAHFDTDGYAQSCPAFRLNRSTHPGK